MREANIFSFEESTNDSAKENRITSISVYKYKGTTNLTGLCFVRSERIDASF